MQGLKFGRKRRGSSLKSGTRKKTPGRSGLRFERERGRRCRAGAYGRPAGVNVSGALRWAAEIILVCAAAFLLVLSFGCRVSNAGDSMKPVLENGEVVLVNRLCYRIFSPSRGDIVAYSRDGSGQYSIKRIVGLPGETVQIVDGSVYINDEKMTDDIYAEDIEYAGIAAAPVELGEGEYFVIGDNSEASDDSRSPDAGPVRKNDIYGKVWFVADFGEHFGFI
mgnify:CR=1 FL=1